MSSNATSWITDPSVRPSGLTISTATLTLPDEYVALLEPGRNVRVSLVLHVDGVAGAGKASPSWRGRWLALESIET